MIDNSDGYFGGGSPEPDTEAVAEKIRKWVENRRAEWEEDEWKDFVLGLYEDGCATGMSRKRLEDIRNSEKKVWLKAEEAQRAEEARIAKERFGAAEGAERTQQAAEEARKRRQEEQFFEEIKAYPTIQSCKRYLTQYPEGRYVRKVNKALDRLQNRHMNLLQLGKKTALVIALLASVCFIVFIASKTIGRKKEPNMRILWLIGLKDPREDMVGWSINSGYLTASGDFFRSVKRVNGTIDFKHLPNVKTENLAATYDILIIQTLRPEEFKVADEFVRTGKSVIVFADYTRYHIPGDYYATVTNREFLNRFGIQIEKTPRRSIAFYNWSKAYRNLRLIPSNHPISMGITDIIVKYGRGEYISYSKEATPVLYRKFDHKPWAVAWDGHNLNQGRVLVIPETNFWLRKYVQVRGRNRFIFWEQAFKWLSDELNEK